MNFHTRPQPSKALSFLWLELTSKCNLECVHCYADSSPVKPLHEAMTFADWKQALVEASELGCRNTQFIGGEPTLYPGLPDLIGWARTCEFERLEVYTNGLHFTPALRSAFVKHRVSLAFSVYSSEAPVHDAITKRNGSLVRTLDSIRWAVAEGLPVRAGIIGMEANKGHVERTREFLIQLGVSDATPDRVRGIGRGAQTAAIDSPYEELCGQCSKGRLCLTASGQMYPCVFSRFCRIGVFTDGLHSAMHSTALLDFKKHLRTSLASTRNSQSDDCRPDTPQPDCRPDTPQPDCRPDTPQPDCRPDTPQPDCRPDMPSVCKPERTASSPKQTSPKSFERHS